MSAFYRLGVWCAKHAKAVLLGWLVVLLVAGSFALGGVSGEGLFERLDNGVPEVAGEAAAADEALEEAVDADSGYMLTLLIHGVDPLDEALGRQLDRFIDEAEAIQTAHAGTTVAVSDPREGLAALAAGVELPPEVEASLAIMTADDGNGLLVRVEVVTPGEEADEALADSHDEAIDGSLEALQATAAAIEQHHPDADVFVSSSSLIAQSYRVVAADDLARGEGIALPIALLVMIVIFGGLLAAGIPLIGAIASIVAGMGTLFGLSFIMGFDSMVVNVITVLGLGLAIDYGLLMYNRFREEARDHVDDIDRAGFDQAVGRTVEHAGRTVAFSGTIFIAAASGLLLFEPAIMRAIGVGVIVVVVLAVVLSITLVPSLFALAGRRVLRPGVLARFPGSKGSVSRVEDPDGDDGFFGKVGRWAQRRPAAVTIVSLLILGVFAAPTLALTPTNDVSGALPRAASQYPFLEALGEHFTGAGEADVRLVVEAETSAAAISTVEGWAARLGEDAIVSSVGAVALIGDYAVIDVEPAEGNAGVVARLARDNAPSDADVSTWVTGSAARDLDLISSVTASAPWAALVVVVFTFVLLFLMTGAIIMPLKSLFIALLSLGSAVGLLVWGFQWGNLAGVLSFNTEDVAGVDILVLTITLALGFGLSMDYEVFLLGRVVELRDQGVPGREAIWRGLQSTGKIITSAALIMVVVFLGFTVGDLLVIKQMGAALAFLVVLDAALVRCILVPALMTWQERIMWWSPKWLRPVADRFRIRH